MDLENSTHSTSHYDELTFVSKPFAWTLLYISIIAFTEIINCLLIIVIRTATSSSQRHHVASRRDPASYLFLSLAVADLLVGAVIMPIAALQEMVIGRRWIFDAIPHTQIGPQYNIAHSASQATVFQGTLPTEPLLTAEIILSKELTAQNELLSSNYQPEALIPSTSCAFWTWADVTLCTASIFHLCAISLDRYALISRPLRYAPKRKPGRMAIYIGSAWLCAALVSAPSMYGPYAAGLDPSTGACAMSLKLNYQMYAMVASFYVPLALMCVLNYRIYRAVKKMVKANERASSNLFLASPSNQNVDIRTRGRRPRKTNSAMSGLARRFSGISSVGFGTPVDLNVQDTPDHLESPCETTGLMNETHSKQSHGNFLPDIKTEIGATEKKKIYDTDFRQNVTYLTVTKPITGKGSKRFIKAKTSQRNRQKYASLKHRNRFQLSPMRNRKQFTICNIVITPSEDMSKKQFNNVVIEDKSYELNNENTISLNNSSNCINGNINFTNNNHSQTSTRNLQNSQSTTEDTVSFQHSGVTDASILTQFPTKANQSSTNGNPTNRNPIQIDRKTIRAPVTNHPSEFVKPCKTNNDLLHPDWVRKPTLPMMSIHSGSNGETKYKVSCSEINEPKNVDVILKRPVVLSISARSDASSFGDDDYLTHGNGKLYRMLSSNTLAKLGSKQSTTTKQKIRKPRTTVKSKKELRLENIDGKSIWLTLKRVGHHGSKRGNKNRNNDNNSGNNIQNKSKIITNSYHEHVIGNVTCNTNQSNEYKHVKDNWKTEFPTDRDSIFHGSKISCNNHLPSPITPCSESENVSNPSGGMYIPSWKSSPTSSTSSQVYFSQNTTAGNLNFADASSDLNIGPRRISKRPSATFCQRSPVSNGDAISSGLPDSKRTSLKRRSHSSVSLFRRSSSFFLSAFGRQPSAAADAENKEKVNQQQKAATTLGLITAGFICCWFPFFGTTLASSLSRAILGRSLPLPKWWLGLVLWLGYVNSALNPCFVIAFNRDFKKAFQQIIRKLARNILRCLCCAFSCVDKRKIPAWIYTVKHYCDSDVENFSKLRKLNGQSAFEVIKMTTPVQGAMVPFYKTSSPDISPPGTQL